MNSFSVHGFRITKSGKLISRYNAGTPVNEFNESHIKEINTGDEGVARKTNKLEISCSSRAWDCQAELGQLWILKTDQSKTLNASYFKSSDFST